MIESEYPKMTTLKLLVVLMFLATTAAAQRGPAPQRTRPPLPPRDLRRGQSRSSTMQVELPAPMAETPVPFGVPSVDGMDALQPLGSVSPDLSFDRQVVAGAPFSAETTTEHIQTLADGNRFVRRSSALLYRDQQGRTRRDHMDDRRGGVASLSDPQSPVISIINDPVAHTNIVLDHRDTSARRMELPPALYNLRQETLANDTGEPRFGILVPRSAVRRGGPAGDEPTINQPEKRTEKLEPRTIEGVLAEGTRTTLVIAAGEFGNEQPMEITQERWYSPELRTVVLMRHNDPRFGETTFRLTNINRGDPDATIFRIPSNYKLKERARSPIPDMRRRLPPN